MSKDASVGRLLKSHRSILCLQISGPCAKSYVKAAQAPLGAATIGETKKCRLYDDRCKRQDYLFYPVVVEVFGGMGVRGRDLISKIDEEGKLNGINRLHGMRIKTYLLF